MYMYEEKWTDLLHSLFTCLPATTCTAPTFSFQLKTIIFYVKLGEIKYWKTYTCMFMYNTWKRYYVLQNHWISWASKVMVLMFFRRQYSTMLFFILFLLLCYCFFLIIIPFFQQTMQILWLTIEHNYMIYSSNLRLNSCICWADPQNKMILQYMYLNHAN